MKQEQDTREQYVYTVLSDAQNESLKENIYFSAALFSQAVVSYISLN